MSPPREGGVGLTADCGWSAQFWVVPDLLFVVVLASCEATRCRSLSWPGRAFPPIESRESTTASIHPPVASSTPALTCIRPIPLPPFPHRMARRWVACPFVLPLGVLLRLTSFPLHGEVRWKKHQVRINTVIFLVYIWCLDCVCENEARGYVTRKGAAPVHVLRSPSPSRSRSKAP